MTTIGENIIEYRRSCGTLQQRIDQLTGKIANAAQSNEGTKQLEARRYMLYCELAEMREHISQLQEYLDCTDCQPQAANQ